MPVEAASRTALEHVSVACGNTVPWAEPRQVEQEHEVGSS